MTDKLLTEATWKAFAKSGGHSENALPKALGALAKAEKDGPDAELEALDEVEKQIKVLRGAKKADKDLQGYLDKMTKALESDRKSAEKAQKEAAANAASDDEEEETPALLTSKMIPLIRQVRKGDSVMQALIATAGKDTAVLLSRRSISPARGKLLKEFLGASGGLKFIRGECLLEENAITFVVQSQAAGLAKKLKAALLLQTEMRLKVRVRGEDPDDLDEEGDGEDQDGSGGEPAGPGATGSQTAPGAPVKEKEPDPQQAVYEARMAKVEPILEKALKQQAGDVSKMRAVSAFVREKADAKLFAAALQGLDMLDKLLAAANQAQASDSGSKDKAVDAGAAFTARLGALMPKVQAAMAAAGPAAAEIKDKIGEAGKQARSHDYDAAHATLDAAELLLAPGGGGKEGKDGGKPDDPRQAEFEALKASLQDQFDAVVKATLTGENATLRQQAVAAWNMAGDAADGKNFERAALILKRLADGKLLARLEQAGQAPVAPGADRGRIVRQRQFLLQRWKRIPGELQAQLKSLEQTIAKSSADPNPDELVSLIEDSLDDLLEELQDEIDDAINDGDTGVFEGLRQRVQSHSIMEHLQSAPDFDGRAVMRKVLDAVDEIEKAMTAA